MRHISNFFPILHSFCYLKFSIYLYLWVYFFLLIHNIKIMKAACHQVGTLSLRKFNESTYTEIFFLSILRYNLRTKEVNSMHFNNLPMKPMPQSSYRIFPSYPKASNWLFAVPQCLHYLTHPRKPLFSCHCKLLYFFRIMYEANYIVSTLCVWLNYFETDCCFVIQYFIPFYQWVVFHFMNLQTFFTHSSVDEHWIITKFLLLWIKVPWIFL